MADQATVTGRNNPTRTVTFTLYDIGNCTGTPLFTDTETLDGGSATSMPYFPFSTGTDYWAATYNGDINNNPVTSGCAAEPVTINKVSPTLSTAPTPPVAVVGAQLTLKDNASLVVFGPSGFIEFFLFDPNGNLVDSESVLVEDGGDYITPVGYTFTPATPGQYVWEVDYSGDANNFPPTAGPRP